MPNENAALVVSPICTAFHRDRRIASGSYISVARTVKAYIDTQSDASVLIFDDATGQQIDFDLRGSEADIAARIATQFPDLQSDSTRSPGRPKLGVVSREITLLPRHWQWLEEQPGGASVTLRRLVEDARRLKLTNKAQLRKLHERTYAFMSAVAGNLPNFEEAARALFANKILMFRALIADWPVDVRDHALLLCSQDASLAD